MKDTLLFAVVPYVAVVTAAMGLVWRGAARLRRGAARPAGAGPHPGAWARRIGLGGIVLEHLVGFALPAEVLVWYRTPVGALVLEGLAFTFAGLALVGCLLGAAFGFRRAWRAGRTADVVSAVLLAVVLASGIAIGLTHRWSTGWYTITIVPYLQSLVSLEPRLDLAVPMPFLVRLHLLGGFALLAVAPFYGLAGAERRLRRTDAAPAPLHPYGLGTSGEGALDG